MVCGQGLTTNILTDGAVTDILAESLPLALDGKRVLVIIPDGTRTAPIP